VRFKFRAYDKNHKKWYDRVMVGCDGEGNDYICHSVYCEDRGEWLNFDDGCGTVVQWTGLRDKNGVDIWERDVVERDGNHFVIEWSNHGWWAIGKSSRWSCWANDVFAVVGNIYENPELIGRQATDSTAILSESEAE
jgi:hypothetical protein